MTFIRGYVSKRTYVCLSFENKSYCVCVFYTVGKRVWRKKNSEGLQWPQFEFVAFINDNSVKQKREKNKQVGKAGRFGKPSAFSLCASPVDSNTSSMVHTHTNTDTQTHIGHDWQRTERGGKRRKRCRERQKGFVFGDGKEG